MNADTLRSLADFPDTEGIPVALGIQIACCVFVGVSPRAREILVDAYTVGGDEEIGAILQHISHGVSLGSAAFERRRRIADGTYDDIVDRLEDDQ